MTRINLSIPVSNLTDEHLLAEHREIKRLPSCLQKAILSGSINNIPNKFCLCKGHILFFLNKMLFVFNRYKEIYNECLNRHFNVSDYSSNFLNIDVCYNNDYIPNSNDKQLLQQRIIDRILNGKCNNYHYYGKSITKEQACSLLFK